MQKGRLAATPCELMEGNANAQPQTQLLIFPRRASPDLAHWLRDALLSARAVT
jgi:hypothetical protein